MYSAYILVSVILMTSGTAADSGPGEYTTTSIQEPCVPSQECPQEVLHGWVEAEAAYQEAALTKNQSLMSTLNADGFIVRGCDLKPITCKQDFFDAFAMGQKTTDLGSGYCELINSDTAYWEFYQTTGSSGYVYSVNVIYKKVEGKWLFFRGFAMPPHF